MEIWQHILSRVAPHSGLWIQLVFGKNTQEHYTQLCYFFSLITLSTRSHSQRILPWKKATQANCHHLYIVFSGLTHHPWWWDLISLPEEHSAIPCSGPLSICSAWYHASLRLFGNVEIPGISVKLDEKGVWPCIFEKYIHLVRLSE